VSSEEENPSVGQSFPGGDFADARHSLGLSFEQLVRELRLPVKTLEAIEAGSFDKLGGPVFARGYIRAYARRLKLDPDRYVGLYDQVTGAKDTRSTVRVVGSVSTTPARQSRSLMRLGSLIFVLAILATVVWWWQTQYSIDAVIAPENDAPVTVDTADGNTLVLPPLNDGVTGELQAESAVSEAMPDEGVVEDGAQDEALVVEETPATEDVVVEGEDRVTAMAEPEPELEPEPVDEPAAVEQQEENVLHLSLSDDSWLSVKDAAGRSLFNGIAKGGQELNLQGEEPLSVVIGRVSAVGLIEYAGEPVDIGSVSNKNVARLTLPASQR